MGRSADLSKKITERYVERELLLQEIVGGKIQFWHATERANKQTKKRSRSQTILVNFSFFFFFVVVFLYIDARIRFGHICERSHEKIWKATSLKVWERKQQQQKSEWKLPLESGSCFFLILLLLLKKLKKNFSG